MDKLSVFIVEDNSQTVRKLEKYIEKNPNLVLQGIAVTGNQALEVLREEVCDLILLDVHLPDISGIEVLESLDAIPTVIFITAHDKYAVKAFELGAVDYLRKPFTYDRFEKAIERVISTSKKPYEKEHYKRLGFNINDRGRQFLIPFDDIYYITSNGKNSVVHTSEKDIDLARMLGDIAKKLPEDLFQRIHKKYIINLKQMLSLEHIKSGLYKIHFIDDVFSPLPVGRPFVKKLKTKWKPHTN